METKQMGSAVMMGVVTILGLALIIAAIFATILRFTDLQEQSIQIILTIFSFITVFIGGMIAGGKAKQKGWIFGFMTGAIYTLIVFLFQYLGHDSLFSFEQMIYHTCYITTSMMGGILGVNLSSK
ncbi:membrane protein [Bacillus coahuilensis m2-6]|uniref:Membrane protein n=1 Tax=Bacillus coahuilensis p1.1.43 TaxID=1150625 RepID=A0A147K766_9BACI|nr:TIGR04086 family membrane protein [Bacillus coahuilensis]KUP05841.1 membrane protein [Bacillus coahuilensis p1.1.43]KUP06936.1 membrane protein [Bacillus coahuilensis m2-6]